MTKKEKIQMYVGVVFVIYFFSAVLLIVLEVASFGFISMISIPIFLIFGIGAQVIYGAKF